jgi:hypothetical protein
MFVSMIVSFATLIGVVIWLLSGNEVSIESVIVSFVSAVWSLGTFWILFVPHEPAKAVEELRVHDHYGKEI